MNKKNLKKSPLISLNKFQPSWKKKLIFQKNYLRFKGIIFVQILFKIFINNFVEKNLEGCLYYPQEELRKYDNLDLPKQKDMTLSEKPGVWTEKVLFLIQILRYRKKFLKSPMTYRFWSISLFIWESGSISSR